MAVNQEFKKLLEMIKYKHSLSQSAIAKQLGIGNTYLSDILSGRVTLSDNMKQKLYENFSDCFNEQNETTNNTFIGDHSNNINGNSNVVVDSTTFQKALDEISEMRKALTDALQKSQEDNRRLMTLLEQLQNEK